jgi:crotonobetainyl-CoA:carnitine CoA-transferase CaiB-like acyl-CoA transferase
MGQQTLAVAADQCDSTAGAQTENGSGEAIGGQVIDVAIFESMFNLMEAVVPEYSGTGVVRESAGTTVTSIVPINTYRCRDNKCGHRRQWRFDLQAADACHRSRRSRR